MGIFSLIGELFGPVTKVIDDLHLSDEERAKIEAKVKLAQIDAQIQALELDAQIAKSQADVVVAEAQGESTIQRVWRPIVMLTFTGLIVAKWFGLSAPGITEQLELQLMNIIQFGLGGYIMGRSGEKMIKTWRAK